jgi:hypothetical protein
MIETSDSILLWLSQQALPLLILCLLAALIVLALHLSAKHRLQRMNDARVGVNEDTFVNSLLVFGFDPAIARATYRYLQQTQRVNFPIERGDLLDEDLGLDSDEIEESLIDLLNITQRLHRPGLRHAPLVTVEDLVRVVQASPRLSELAA